MQLRTLLPALLVSFAGVASAQATAPDAAPASMPDAAQAAAPAASAGSAPVRTAADQPQQRCHKEIRVGSNLPKTVCEPAPTEQERAKLQDDWRNEVHSHTQGRTIGQ